MRRDTMTFGRGYWIKQPGEILFEGANCFADTVDVKKGWNIIGSLTKAVPTEEVRTIPEGIIASEYYGYGELGYNSVETIEPAKAYWVLVKQNGKLVLKTGTVRTK